MRKCYSQGNLLELLDPLCVWRW